MRAPAPARAPSAARRRRVSPGRAAASGLGGRQGRGLQLRPVGRRLRGLCGPGPAGGAGGGMLPPRGDRGGRATCLEGGVRPLWGPVSRPGPSSELEICGLSLAGGRCWPQRWRSGSWPSRPDSARSSPALWPPRWAAHGTRKCLPASAIELFSQKDKHPRYLLLQCPPHTLPWAHSPFLPFCQQEGVGSQVKNGKEKG